MTSHHEIIMTMTNPITTQQKTLTLLRVFSIFPEPDKKVTLLIPCISWRIFSNMGKFAWFLLVLAVICISAGAVTGNPRTIELNDVEEVEETPPQVDYGATRMKNKVRGPADMGIYYINNPGGKLIPPLSLLSLMSHES